MIADSLERKQCLDPNSSFIVQAPAGSGKTSILVQRFLSLLAKVDKFPEECLAITFTRKAANEMQSRVIQALIDAKNNKSVNSDYEKINYDLAKKVLLRDEKEGWNLTENPSRIKIQTFDSFCSSLVKKMPVTTGLGVSLEIAEDSSFLYKKAIDILFENINKNDSWCKDLENLFLHLDNDWDLVKDLLIKILAVRDQWLNHVVTIKSQVNIEDKNVRSLLELGLELEIKSHIEKIIDLLPENIESLLCIASNAAKNLKLENIESNINYCNDLENWPDDSSEQFNKWLGIAELLVSKNGKLRKTVTKSQGFFPPSYGKTKEEKEHFKNIKQEMLIILESLTYHKELIEKLHELTLLPNKKYTDNEWNIIKSIVEVLPVLVGYLQVVFKETGKLDFIEVSLAAIKSLGDELEPTDLALELGYRINHILIDEFQDTSISQFDLIKKLITSWDMDDRRTLFLVGDPQQSIYSFRQAEVGLFLSVWENGIGSVPIIPLSLRSNFRSHPNIVNWFNKVFKLAFPKENDISNGGVKFSGSIAASESNLDSFANCIDIDNLDLEPKAIVKIIQKEQQENPNSSIAILVRSRKHLENILPHLKQANIDFVGADLDSLSNKRIVQDLLSLTKAILHLGDRIAWLAILRAPWCGLTLKDLYEVVNFNNNNLIWENILNSNLLTNISIDGKKRLAKLKFALTYGLDNLGRKPIKDLINEVWHKLDGPSCLLSPMEQHDSDSYFNFLSNLDNNNDIYEVGFLEENLSKIYAKQVISENNYVHIMTIHKSKGLEFDTVILPGLHRKPTYNISQLLLWQEKLIDGESYLLMAPIKEYSSKDSKLYNYLKHSLKKKEKLESLRLLYVAVTRAKNRLYCIANKSESAKDSLLSLAWDGISPFFDKGFQEPEENIELNKNLSDSENQNLLQRLPSSFF